MRGNIEGLVGNEMQGVVELLAKAESGQPDEQAQAAQEARRLIRHVTIRLSAERQMLLRRLKVADIAAQVRRLAGQQSAVLKATESLPQQLPGRREAVTLAALEQQRTAGSLYGVLVASLEDVRTWEGPVGAAATESLRRLRDGQAETFLKAAEERLATSDFAAAATAQRQVLDLLATLEQRIERSQGASASRADAALAAVRDMQRQREELRAEIAKAPPTDAAIEALAEKQAELRQDLNKLDDVAATAPDVAPLVQKAKEAATPALYFTNLISARPLMGPAGAGSLAQVINAALANKARFDTMKAFFEGVGHGPSAGVWEETPEDRPEFKARYAKQMAALRKSEEAMGT